MLAMLLLLANAVAPLYLPDAESIFAPPTLSVSDRAQIVIDGWKHAACDETAPPKFTVFARDRLVVITLAAETRTGTCQPVMARFTSVVELGSLAVGKWRVAINGGGLEAAFDVNDVGSTDDADLAAVAGVDVEDAVGGGWNAVIAGSYSNSCERLAELRVVPGARAYDIAPLVARRDGSDCVAGTFPFVERVALPEPTVSGRHLVHVRSRAGSPVNRIFSVGDLDIGGKDGH